MADVNNNVLGDWLRAMRTANDWSYQDVANQATRHGHKVARATVERIEKTRPDMVKRDQIAWIVDVFGVPPRSVVQMFMHAMGYGLGVTSVTSVEGSVEMDATLSRRDKELLGALLIAMRARPAAAAIEGGGSADSATKAQKSGEGQVARPRFGAGSKRARMIDDALPVERAADNRGQDAPEEG